jgi:hypothetical protein
MQVGVVVVPVHRMEGDIPAMGFVYHLSSLSNNRNLEFHRGDIPEIR